MKRVFSVLGITAAVLGGTILLKHLAGLINGAASLQEEDDDFEDEDFFSQRDGLAL